jgi:predicted ATPase
MDEAEYVAGNPRWSGSERMVVISGCSGGGKSALIAELGLRGYPTFPEPGRQVAKEQALVGGDALPARDLRRFAELCIARASYFFNVADPAEKPVFFDRSIIDAVNALARLGEVPPAAAAAARLYRYGRVFLLPPWGELFANDPERTHAFDEAVAEYESLLRAFPSHGYDPVLVPHASVAARADFVEATLAGTAP